MSLNCTYCEQDLRLRASIYLDKICCVCEILLLADFALLVLDLQHANLCLVLHLLVSEPLVLEASLPQTVNDCSDVDTCNKDVNENRDGYHDVQ